MAHIRLMSGGVEFYDRLLPIAINKFTLKYAKQALLLRLH